MRGQRYFIVGAGLIAAAAIVYATCAANRASERVSYRDLGARIDASDLTPLETKRLDEILNREVSPCGDDVSLGASLFAQDKCPLARPAADFVIGMLKQDYDVEEISQAYVARFASVRGLDISVDGSPRMGPARAAINVVVFSDFECPFCAKMQEILARLVRQYPEHVAVVFKHYPLSIHPTAELAARAAYAAQRQDRFWEMHDTLFSAQGTPVDNERIRIMALGLGMDVARFEKDMNSAGASDALQADRLLGEKLGVGGTPTVFVNGRKVEGGAAEIEQRIREEFLRASVKR